MSSLNEIDGTTAALLYVIINAVLLTFVTLCSYDRSKSLTKNGKIIWKKRSIYFTVYVQIFDQASDIGVLILWYNYGRRESDNSDYIEHIDAQTFFDLSCLSLIFNRILQVNIASLACIYGVGDVIDPLLAFLELYIIKQVYHTYKSKIYEPTKAMRMAQLYEALMESIPQMIFQSVFLIRTSSGSSSISSTNISVDQFFILASIFFSVISVANKFTAWDKNTKAFHSLTNDLNLQKKKPFANIYYIIRILWRLLHVLSRLFMIVLIWAICGGVFVIIFIFGVSFIVYCCVEHKFLKHHNMLQYFVNYLLYHIVAVVWTTPTDDLLSHHNKSKKNDDVNYIEGSNPHLRMIHFFVETLVYYAIILVFSLSTFDCVICADPQTRYLWNNSFAFDYIVSGFCATIISFLLYIIYFLQCVIGIW